MPCAVAASSMLVPSRTLMLFPSIERRTLFIFTPAIHLATSLLIILVNVIRRRNLTYNLPLFIENPTATGVTNHNIQDSTLSIDTIIISEINTNTINNICQYIETILLT